MERMKCQYPFKIPQILCLLFFLLLTLCTGSVGHSQESPNSGRNLHERDDNGRTNQADRRMYNFQDGSKLRVIKNISEAFRRVNVGQCFDKSIFRNPFGQTEHGQSQNGRPANAAKNIVGNEIKIFRAHDDRLGTILEALLVDTERLGLGLADGVELGASSKQMNTDVRQK